MWTIAAIAIVGSVLLWLALHYSGGAGEAKGELVCAKNDNAQISAALQQQQREDAKSIASLKSMLASAQAAAVRAAQQAGVAQAKADALTATLDSLNRTAPDVKAWSDTRLPQSLLRGMRAQANDQAGRSNDRQN